jgi:hypothetical protein
MDSRLEKLKENLESAVEGVSSEQWSWHPQGKWCAAEVLEHLYLTYTETIHGFERVMASGRPLAAGIRGATRANLRGRGIGPHARRTKSPRICPAEGLAGGAGAKRDRGKDCGNGCDHRAV